MARKRYLSALAFLGISYFFTACIPKKQSCFTQKQLMPLCITMPQANTLARNIAPQVHRSLLHSFKQMGYNLTHTPSSGYTLQTNIVKFETQRNYVSPDILLFHSLVTLELHVCLLNTTGQVVTEKNFSISVILSKPRNPLLHNSFIFTQLEKKLLQLTTRIEFYFRQYLFPKKTV